MMNCSYPFSSGFQLALFAFAMDYGYNPFSDFDSHSRPLVTKFFGGPMRHSKAEKTKTHERIVALASRRFREQGLAGIGIADLMKEAGLTVGGFYKHFNSRDALVAEAVGLALELWKDQVDAAASGGPPVTYESLVDEYLSETHRNHPGAGCPVGALAGDLARSDKRTRALVSRKIRDNIELLVTLIRKTKEMDEGSARSQAVLTYCALVGAISMARAVSDEELSSEILKTAALRLKNPVS
jgi:TetR/AcrR family transcriptional repressor of nem operon